jgi:MerR family copper efflux transcriptional regulator
LLAIQEVVKITGLTSRALRVYEEAGILDADARSDSGVRLYAPESVERLKQIIAMKSVGVTLKDISALLDKRTSNESVYEIFSERMAKVDEQISHLQTRRKALQKYLITHESCTESGIDSSFLLSERERIELFALAKLESADSYKLSSEFTSYLYAELDCFSDHPDAFALIPAVEKILRFAEKNSVTIGSSRGSASGSLLFYLMGLSKCDPVKWNLKPAMFFGGTKTISIDVSYCYGSQIIELCNELSAQLVEWKIEAFRLPILDIIDSVNAKVGPVLFDNFSDNSKEVLRPLKEGDCEKIFGFDEPGSTLAGKLYSEQKSEWTGYERMNEFLKSQDIYSFSDVLNIQALKRPKSRQYLKRMFEYVERKTSFAQGSRNDRFVENFGMIIYHEDIIDLIEKATSWGPLEANQFRLRSFKEELTESDRLRFLRDSNDNSDILGLIEESAPYCFSKAHVASSGELVKRSAILKSLHKEIYFDEIKRWEDSQGLSWADFGFRNEQVCLLK